MSKIKAEKMKNQKPPEEDPMLIVKVESAGFDAGNFAKISINDKAIDCEPNEYQHFRGLHIVVIHPTNGEVKFAKVFDTYQES